MFKGLFFPKPPLEDLPPQERPKTRRALFRQTFGNYWSWFFAVNLVCYVFYLPASVWTELSLESLLTLETAAFQTAPFMGAYLAGLAACLFITGPMLAGISLLMRNWSRGEPCMRWQTLFGGMKRNFAQALGFSLIEGLMPLAAYSALRYYGNLGDSAGVGYYVLFGFIAIVVIFALLMRQLVYTILVTYRLKFGQIIKNAFLLTFLELPRSFLTLLINLSPIAVIALLLWLLPAYPGLLVVLALAYYALFGIALERFVSASFANRVLEKHFNAKLPGAKVDIGMASESVVE
ncbi:MAG: hypothetical protein CVV04_13095 [Firmicutes bacterium HGW-Firmicutes-9]|jgi:uncharacterized membrane protein YesL|nr:MAG: hypothetical protein CVV04_13095 [Firmicutes bacterium HGW-Firmicutes-9]